VEKILGQLSAVHVLQTALDSGRMHHAWIFHGPSGVGKATTALRLARVLLCPDAQSDLGGHVTACGSCRSCQLIDDPEAAHPDLHVVVKELARYHDERSVRDRKLSNIPRGVLEQHLIEPAYRSAQMSHGKVFIVDEAELLDLTGQNTLLKTLEEPPAGTYIILVTSQEDRLLPTIRSRCQRVAFGLLDEVTVRTWLGEYLAGQEEVAMPTEQLEWVVRFARGSLGQAKLAIEYRLDTWQQALEPAVKDLTRGKGAGDMGPTMAKLANEFADQWVARNANASKDAANKAAVRHMLGLVGEMCRQRIGELAGALSIDDADTADRAMHPWLRGIDLAQTADRHLATNVSPALLLDNLAIQWAASV
jgi:DNA polymerase-3 subunit delta'